MDIQALGRAAALASPVQVRTVPGRVALIDCDFYCYQVADLSRSAAEDAEACLDKVRMEMGRCGAETAVAYVSLGLKSGRHEIATVKPYQETRVGKNLELKARVVEIREHLARIGARGRISVRACLHREADDELATDQCSDLANSVLLSGDKDLWMIPGWHFDEKSGELYHVDGYGTCKYQDVGNKEPKLIGRGTSWFWHQMIMGDTADNIPGLPELSGPLAERYIPGVRPNPKRKPVKCGEAKAVAMLKDVTTDQEAARRVAEAYQHHYGTAWQGALVEQAYLLWIQRGPHPWGVLEFLRYCDLTVYPTETQREAIELYRDRARAI